MSRIPKFRAWYKPLGVMIEPEKLAFINFDIGAIGVYLDMDGKGYHVLRMSDFELMQYTGTPDYYEGDVVKTPFGNIGVIAWHEQWCGFYFKLMFGKNDDNQMVRMRSSKPLYNDLPKYVKLGNIHDNPELLEGA